MGEKIPFYGRLLKVADILSVLLHRRSYDSVSASSSVNPEALLPVLEVGAGREFDPSLAEVAASVLHDARTSEYILDHFLFSHPVYRVLGLDSIVLFD
jgi:HD-GYP domain-containing protein (c-di-GMP phosphodiesterase class II)